MNGFCFLLQEMLLMKKVKSGRKNTNFLQLLEQYTAHMFVLFNHMSTVINM